MADAETKDKNVQWAAYKKALKARDLADAEITRMFAALFEVGGAVSYRRQTRGRVHSGKIVDTSAWSQRLRVYNPATGKEYWIDAYWIVRK